MKSFRARAITAIATVFVLASCGEWSANVTAPDHASYDGGHTFGGGNRSDTTTATTASRGGEAVVSGGGFTFGGGN